MKTLELLARCIARCIFCVALLASFACADSIHLRNGRQLRGKYIGGTPTAINFMTGGSVQYIPTSELVALVFDNDSSDNGTETPLGDFQPNSLHPGSNVHIQPGVLRSMQETPSLIPYLDFSLPAQTLQFAQLAQMVPLVSCEEAAPDQSRGQSADTKTPASLTLNVGFMN